MSFYGITTDHDDRPTAHDIAKDDAREAMEDAMMDAKFAPEFDDVFAPEDGNTEDILIDTKSNFGRPVRNDCVGCGDPVPDHTWIAGNDPVCDQCYADLWDARPTCNICDAYGHGYPGAGPCPLEDRGYDTDGIYR